MQIITKNYTF